MKKSIKILFYLVIGVYLTSGFAFALQFGFENITNNNAGDAAIGEAQLFMDVTAFGNDILFLFTNIGPNASSITDIYFDDNVPLLQYKSFIESTGVDFTVGASPPNLPGGQDPSYLFFADYAYDSASPAQPNGVNPYESLGILFGYDNNATFDGVLAALTAGSFRVGIHVQGFATEGSEAFISDPPPPSNPVPEPATMMLLGTGLIGLAGVSRKKFKK